MLYIEQSIAAAQKSFKALERINRLSFKVVYDSIKPFIETPPEETNIRCEKRDTKAADLFSMFTADIIKSNVLFTR
jgi:hypothetical protein